MLRVFRTQLRKRRTGKMQMETADVELTDETVDVLRALGYVK